MLAIAAAEAACTKGAETGEKPQAAASSNSDGSLFLALLAAIIMVSTSLKDERAHDRVSY